MKRTERFKIFPADLSSRYCLRKSTISNLSFICWVVSEGIIQILTEINKNHNKNPAHRLCADVLFYFLQ